MKMQIDRHMSPEIKAFIDAVEKMLSSQGRVEHALAWRKDPVDLKIRPLVDALNAFGLETFASCAGHFFGLRSPYVAFKGNFEKVAIIDEYLSKNLHYDWDVEIFFDHMGKSTFIIFSHYLSTVTSMPVRILEYVFNRRYINKDIDDLSNFLLDMVNRK